jgi:hypothetical protein
VLCSRAPQKRIGIFCLPNKVNRNFIVLTEVNACCVKRVQ